MKDITRQLHQGLSVKEAKERFEKEIGDISSTEIAEIEPSRTTIRPRVWMWWRK